MSFNEVIDQIKQYPISDLIGNYIAVKKVGSGHEAMCPFHGDSNPSLKISDSKKLYKCFACGASGDHISFVQNFKSIEFIDAIKEIAGQFNISTDSLDQNKNKDPKLEMAQRVLTSANKLYKKYAQTSHKKDYDEFIKNRGLTEELALDFNIGFAPKGNVFLEYLQTIPGKDKEFAMQVAQDIGIIKKGQNGLYDAFRSRITFPIKDQLGHVRGFSCRATYEGQIPKYLNSHESMVFHKRNILYGLDIAKSYIRQKESVIIVEGNMDAVALHQYGFNQTVALMGTAMSEFGITRLKTITKNFFLCLDNDNAGHKAMERI
ncbi:MAG: DNA primase, partial [Thermoproteota archaeon]